MDYGKFRYTEKKKQSEAKKTQVVVVVKEVKFRPRTEEHASRDRRSGRSGSSSRSRTRPVSP